MKCSVCKKEVNYTLHNHHDPPQWMNSDNQTMEPDLCASCHKKREQETWIKYEPYTVLNNFDKYKQMPRKWKRGNPAPHSCINCRYNPPKIGNYQPRLCETEKLFRSKIFLYYPNDCKRFEESL